MAIIQINNNKILSIMRNTYDNKNPYSKSIQESKQRETYSNANPKLMSFQKQAPSKDQTIVDQKTKNILEYIKRISSTNQPKNLGIATFKPNQKTLLNTIALFLSSFDNTFDESALNIQMLPDLFKSLGYPNQINKTYFQPVGAPHTWQQCLTLMQWLGQLAIFHLQIRGHLEQGCFGKDFTSLLIQSFLQQKPQLAKNYLQQQITAKQKTIQNYKKMQQIHKMQIQNLKASQRSLISLQQDKMKLQLTLRQQTQQSIKAEQQNIQLERKLKHLEETIMKQTRQSQELNDQIASLTNQILNQQLSVEEVEKIRFQIRQYQDKITELRRQHQTEKRNLQLMDNNIINEYIEFNQVLESIRNLHKAHRHEIQRRNIQLQVPESDVTKFTHFVKNRAEEWHDAKIQQVLNTKEIKDILEKAQLLAKIVEGQLNEMQRFREQTNNQTRFISEQVAEQSLKNSQLQIQLQDMKTKIQTMRNETTQIQSYNKQTSLQVSQLLNQLKQAYEEQSKLIIETEQLAKETMELGETKTIIEKQIQQSIAKMESRYYDYQSANLQLLEQDCQYFQFCALKEVQIEAYTQLQLNQTQDNQLNRSINNNDNYTGQNSTIKPSSHLNKAENKGFDSPPSERVNRLKDFGPK